MRFGDSTMMKYLGEPVQYKDGEVIFDEDTAGGWVYVVAHGEVEIYKTQEGRKIIIDRVNEGEVLGELSFFDRRARSAAARAVGDTALMKFDDDYLAKEYAKLPHCYQVIIEAMALRLRRSMNRLLKITMNPKVRQALAEDIQRKQP